MTTTETLTEGRTLEFWRTYKAAGGRLVVTRSGETGTLARVTSTHVAVRIGSQVFPRHPGDLDLPAATRFIPAGLR